MKIALYIIGTLFLLLIGFVAFFWFQTNIPALKTSPDTTIEERIQQVDEYLSMLQQKGKFNGAILIAKNHEPLLIKGYGYVDFTKKEKLTTKSSFRLASVSKQFTAAGIMLLKENGLLEYDQPVSDYLKGFPYKKVTVRHLLNQVSGIPDIYMDLAEKQKATIGEILSIQEVVNLINNHPSPKASSPNEKHEYSNTNYVLLAGIIEAITGKSFEQFLQEELFFPLGMKNTRVWNLLSKDKNFENKTSSFAQFMGATKELKPSFIDGVAGDGGIFSSIEDFLIWDKFWDKNTLLSEEHLKEAFDMPILNDGTTSDYGFGWVLTKNGMWHNGSWLGARTLITRNTQKNECLVLLDNSTNISLEDIAQQIAKVLKKRT